MNWALLEDEYGIEYNPAEKIKKRPEQPRDRFLSESELGAYWKALDAEPNPKKADVLRLCLLTAQRQANVLGMHESQLLLNDRIWLVPAGATKTGKTYKPGCAAKSQNIRGFIAIPGDFRRWRGRVLQICRRNRRPEPFCERGGAVKMGPIRPASPW